MTCGRWKKKHSSSASAVSFVRVTRTGTINRNDATPPANPIYCVCSHFHSNEHANLSSSLPTASVSHQPQSYTKLYANIVDWLVSCTSLLNLSILFLRISRLYVVIYTTTEKMRIIAQSDMTQSVEQQNNKSLPMLGNVF